MQVFYLFKPKVIQIKQKHKANINFFYKNTRQTSTSFYKNTRQTSTSFYKNTRRTSTLIYKNTRQIYFKWL